mmetsp:Transcript_10448/g.12933  ORF Transcript_10448/g.12933 Transcript_10448/m.12933 type:complete len:124 (-) Transcript_10448:19-390(-)
MIDDQLFLLLALEAQLVPAGIVTEFREGGQAALNLLVSLVQRNKPLFSVILCDYSMPEMDGVTTAKKIRELYSVARRPQPFIACCSAYSKETIGEAVLSAGMDKVYDKPLNAEQINEIAEYIA